MGRFVKAIDAPHGGDFMEASLLTLYEKEDLCRDLLDEFAADNIRPNDGKHELVHSCVLPFGMHAHGDRNPSASLNYEKLTYHCYSCGGGGFLWFVATCRGIDTDEARLWLGKQTGTGADEQSLDKLLQFLDSVYSRESTRSRIPIPHLDERIIEPWLQIHPYMTEIRHMPVENLERFKVGYGSMRVRLAEDQFVESERIVIPHFWRGDLVGWQSRRLFASDGTSRYLSTPDFPKDTTLYNFRPAEPVVVVESPMSVIKHDHAVHMEATFGASITDAQVRHIAEHPGPIVLWLDNDSAGWLATHGLAEALAPYVPVYVVSSDFAADPADLSTPLVEQMVAEATPYPLWLQPSVLLPIPVAA